MAVQCRPGTMDDSYAVYGVFFRAVEDLSHRLGLKPAKDNDDPDKMATQWREREPLWRHLCETADQFWVAEDDDRIIGYARATVRDGLQELTEFFVDPGRQAAGVGRELLARAFPNVGARRRVIVATVDSRAVTRYLRAGVYPRFPTCYLFGPARAPGVSVEHLAAEPVAGSTADLDTLARIDREVLGYRRDLDHQWLLRGRRGTLFRKQGRVVGYAYFNGATSGPIALLDVDDVPAAIAHAEEAAARAGTEFGLDVPLVNRRAIEYLVRQGYEMSGFITLLMSDEPFGDFERYVFTSPQFFL
jgi:GNAT superfamily N-acetyltransferase